MADNRAVARRVKAGLYFGVTGGYFIGTILPFAHM